MSNPLSEQDVAALTELTIDKWIKFSLDRDWDKFLEMMTDDVVFMPPGQPIVEGKDVVRTWLNSFPPIKAFTSKLVDAEGLGDFACARGTNIMSLDESGVVLPMKGKWIISYRKQSDGSWLCASCIWNLDEPPKTD